MRLIEPCCASKHFMLLRDAIGTHGRTRFEGYGDLSLTEMLPAMLTRYSETMMMIIAPSIPDQAADIIDEWLRKTWARMDGKGRLNVLSHLTIVADLSETASPTLSTWLTNNPYPNRLTLVNKPQDVTALLLPDMVVVGPMNFRYGERFVCEVTTIADEVSEYWKEGKKKITPPDPIEPIEPIEPKATKRKAYRLDNRKTATSSPLTSSNDSNYELS